MQIIKTLGLPNHINNGIPIFKAYVPYDEAGDVLNIARNLLAGGTCLDHLEIRLTYEDYLNTLGAQRFPVPTTARDSLRRFDEMKILMLMCDCPGLADIGGAPSIMSNSHRISSPIFNQGPTQPV
jgi:hypothetical protein